MQIDLQEFVGNDELVGTGKLSALIIETMRIHNTVELFTKEPISAIDIGLIKLLDELVEYYSWNKSDISLRYSNIKETSNNYIQGYNIKPIHFKTVDIRDKMHFPIFNLAGKKQPWSRTKDFGMFIGRLNVTRLCALDRYRNFKYKDRGLTSMNQAPSDDGVNSRLLLEYLKVSDNRWSEIKDIAAYSDIGEVITPPISLPRDNLFGWGNCYSNIAIEIVLETTESNNNIAISEKVLRCILNKRPFMLISSPGVCHQLIDPESGLNKIFNTIPLRLFENVISLDYDYLQGKERVDAVFDALAELIETRKIDSILEDCKDDIEHNYLAALQLMTQEDVLTYQGK